MRPTAHQLARKQFLINEITRRCLESGYSLIQFITWDGSVKGYHVIGAEEPMPRRCRMLTFDDGPGYLKPGAPRAHEIAKELGILDPWPRLVEDPRLYVDLDFGW